MLYREMSPVLGHDDDTRTVTVQLCQWDETRTVSDADGLPYRERFAHGSVHLADTGVHVVDHHNGTLIGRALPDTFRDGDSGPVVDLAVANTAAGSDTLELLRSGVVDSVSVEYDPAETSEGADGVLVRERAVVHGIAFAFRPAHTAPVLATRERQPTMTTETTTEVDAAPQVIAEAVTPELLERSIDELRRDLLTTSDDGTDASGPLAKFRSLGEYALHLAENRDVDQLLHRALADQITSNNAGVVPPAWVQTVKGVFDLGRPAITAAGIQPIPSSGMEVDWPYFDGDLSALVEEQTTQKSAITSVRVDLKKGSADLKTYAGGSDIAYQLIRRSSPSYREAYMRIMANAYAAVTDTVFATAVDTASTASAATWDPATGDGVALHKALFAASIEVETATGIPATYVLAASDVFPAVGGQVVPAQYGTVNTPGTGAASTLTVNVSGLPVVHARGLPSGSLIVSNGEAAAWAEDGPFTVAADDIEKLGQDVAVWGMGAAVLALPDGIRKIGAA